MPHPGGNITGLTFVLGKLMELLKQIAPRLVR